MRPVDAWRWISSTRGSQRPYDDRRQWLQLGMLSASVVAPLIARWNELRGAERASELLGEVETRLKTVGALAPDAYRDLRQQLTEVARQTRQTGGRIMSAGGRGAAAPSGGRLSRSSWLWLAGAGLGLAAAGAGTYLLVRRRLSAAAEEPLLDLPRLSTNGASATSANGSASSATLTRPLSEQPGADLLQDELPQHEEAQQEADEPVIVAPTPWDGGGATLTPTGAPAGVVDPDEAPFIGDIKTMIYHESNAENLPAEQNRVYFASEEEAREAGYQRDRDEVPKA